MPWTLGDFQTQIIADADPSALGQNLKVEVDGHIRDVEDVAFSEEGIVLYPTKPDDPQ